MIIFMDNILLHLDLDNRCPDAYRNRYSVTHDYGSVGWYPSYAYPYYERIAYTSKSIFIAFLNKLALSKDLNFWDRYDYTDFNITFRLFIFNWQRYRY